MSDHPEVLDAPKRIWLTYGDLPGDTSHLIIMDTAEVLWCDTKIDDSDVPYVRADLHEALEARVTKMEAALRNLIAKEDADA